MLIIIAEDTFQSPLEMQVGCKLTHLCHRRSFCSKWSPDQVSQSEEDSWWSCKDKFQTSNELTSAPVKRSLGLVCNTGNGSQ